MGDTEDRVAAEERLAELRERMLDSTTKTSEKLAEELELAEAILEASAEQDKSYRGSIIHLQQQAELYEKQLALNEQMVKEGLMSVETSIQLADEITKQLELTKVLRDEMESYVTTTKEAVDAAKGLGAEFGKIFASFGQNKYLNADNFIKLGAAIQGGKASLMGFGTQMANVGLKSFVDSVIGLAFQLDKSETSFRRATGASESMTREMTAGYERTRLSTVSIQENSAAWNALYVSYTDFTLISPEARKEIGDTTAVLQKLGVSGAASAKGMQVATKAMGQTGAQAAGTLREIAALAADIGEPPQKLAEQFSAMGPSMAKLGNQMGDSFKRLARIQKQTGLEMSKLLNLTDKFDTFESAAEMTGKLNAALGGNFVNAMDMMMETDPAERFQSIRGAIEEAGLSFDDMSYYQRKFYTDSLGLSDVSDLAALMSGDMEAAGVETTKTSAEYADMAKKAREMAEIQEKFNALLQSMIPIVTPLIDVLNGFADWLTESETRVKWFAGGLVTLMLAIKGVSIWMAISHKGAIKAAASKSAEAAATTAASVAKLEESLANSTLVGTQTTLNTTTAVTGKVAGGAAIGMLKFGAAVLMVGAGIGMAAAGIALMGLGLAEMFKVATPEQMISFIAFLLAVGVFGYTGAGFVAGVGFAAMGAGFAVMAFGLAMISEKKLTAIATFAEALSNTSVSEIKALAEAIKGVAHAMDEIPKYKAITLKSVIATTAEALVTARGAGGTISAGGGGGGGYSGPEKIEVVLKLDRKVLAREVRNISGRDQTAINRGEGLVEY